MAEEEHGSDGLELTLEEARLIAGLRRRAARELRESAARAAVPLSPRSHAVAEELGVSPTTARNIANCRDDEKRDYPIRAEHEAQQFRLAARRCPLFIAVDEDLRLYEINKGVKQGLLLAPTSVVAKASTLAREAFVVRWVIRTRRWQRGAGGFPIIACLPLSYVEAFEAVLADLQATESQGQEVLASPHLTSLGGCYAWLLTSGAIVGSVKNYFAAALSSWAKSQHDSRRAPRSRAQPSASARQQRAPPHAVGPRLAAQRRVSTASSAPQCRRPGCTQPRYPNKYGGFHDHCSRSCWRVVADVELARASSASCRSDDRLGF